MRRIGENTYNALNDPTTGSKAQAFVPNYNGYPVLPALGAGTTGFSFRQPDHRRGQHRPHIWIRRFLDLWRFAQLDERQTRFQSSAVKSARALSGIRRRRWRPDDHTAGQRRRCPERTDFDNGYQHDEYARTRRDRASGNNATMRNLLDFLAGSLASVTQLRFMQESDQTGCL